MPQKSLSHALLATGFLLFDAVHQLAYLAYFGTSTN